MGKKKLVEHLEHGVAVRCANGRTVVCEPLMLGDAKFFLEQWERIETGTQKDRIDARLTIAKRFAERYPQLAPHIGLGDVELLLPGFFWRTTGASVVLGNGRSSTGTRSGPTTSPAGTPSPI